MGACVGGGGAENKRRARGSSASLLTDEQLDILGFRIDGLKQEEIARRLGTTRQNVSLIERRARGNILKAEATLRAYRRLQTAATVELKPNTHLVDVPRMLVDAADGAGVKITIDFSLVYKELRDEARDSILGTRVVSPVLLRILRDGKIDVEPIMRVSHQAASNYIAN
jgi:Tfx family DNA-binding protein